jgi:hypothetical protein
VRSSSHVARRQSTTRQEATHGVVVGFVYTDRGLYVSTLGKKQFLQTRGQRPESPNQFSRGAKRGRSPNPFPREIPELFSRGRSKPFPQKRPCGPAGEGGAGRFWAPGRRAPRGLGRPFPRGGRAVPGLEGAPSQCISRLLTHLCMSLAPLLLNCNRAPTK